jgi:hypothetical protein
MAGGIIQAQTKLMVTIGLGASTAIFEAVSEKQPPTSGYFANDPATYPYAATFWFCAACATIGVVLVPWLTIGTQGARKAAENGTDGDAGGVVTAEKEGEESKQVEETQEKA